MPHYILSGKVVDRRTDQGVSGLRIQIRKKKEVIAEGLTDRGGQCTLQVPLSSLEKRLRKNIRAQLEDLLQKQIGERITKRGRRPQNEGIILRLRKEMEQRLERELAKQLERELLDVTVVVFYKEQQLKAVKYEIDWNHKERTARLYVTVDEAEFKKPDEDPREDDPKEEDPRNDEKEHELHVQGRVLKRDETPLPAVVVRAYRKRLRTEELLAEAKTGGDGRYEIHAKVASESYNLLLRVYDKDETEVGASPVLYHATFNEHVDIVVSSEKIKVASEFEKVQLQITPYLDGAEPASLTDEEVAFLEQQTGAEPQQITSYVLAHYIHQQTNAPLETLYGALQIEKPTSLTEFLVKDSDVHQDAVQEAIALNVISEKQDGQALIHHLNQYSVKHVLDTPEDGVGFQLGSLVKLTSLTSDQQHQFIQRYVDYRGDSQSLWNDLREDQTFGKKAVEDLQMTMKLGAITAGHPPLTHLLNNHFHKGQFKMLRDLCRLSQQDWLQLIDEAAGKERENAVPEGIAGDNDEERRLTYAHLLTRTVEDAFPTAVFTEHLRRDDQKIPLREELLEVLDANEDFELHETPVAQYMERHPELLKKVKDPQAVTERLKGIRRAFLLAPRFERYTAVKVLQDHKIDSATKLAGLDRDTFVRAYSGKLGGEARATIIHKNAMQRAGMVQTLIADLGSRYHQTNPDVISFPGDLRNFDPNMLGLGVNPEAAKRLGEAVSEARATWENLFGRMDYCECDHCQSVYSPAAYLTDLLHFLQQRPADEAGRALEVLFERRPDIGHMLLNCQNTNTPLPYIDLVNEVLEERVLQILDQQGMQTRNTTLTEAELRAHPEHVQAAAYTELNTAVYPWRLPFNLFAQETRAYLDHLGIDRHELMTVLQTGSSNDDIHSGSPSVVEIACERLGLLPVEHRLITGIHEQSDDPHLSWDFHSRQAWIDTLREDIPELLARAQLTFKELIALMSTDYLNPEGHFGVRFAVDDTDDEGVSAGDLCDLGQAWFAHRNEVAMSSDDIENLFASLLDRLHRFVRLQRALKWSAYDLDITISTLGAGKDPLKETDTYSLIVRVAHIVTLQDHLDLSLEEILSWYGDINTRTIPETSDQEQTLYAQLFLNHTVTYPINERFKLSSTGQPKGADAESDTPQPDRLSDHAETIQGALRISASEFEQLQSDVTLSDELTLPHLSELHRHSSLARALDITITELLSYKKLLQRRPFDSARIEETLAFIGHVEEVKDSPFALEDLNYLLRHVGPAEDLDRDDEITAALREMREGINEIHSEWRTSSETLAVDDHQQQLSLCQQRSEQLIKETLAGLLEVDTLAGEVLVSRIEAPGTALPVYQSILESDLVASCEAILPGAEENSNDEEAETTLEINRENFPSLYDGIVRLQKAARIVQKWEITETELQQMLTWGAQGHWLNLQQLPVQESAQPAFAQWLRWKNVWHMQQTDGRKDERSLFDLLEPLFHFDPDDQDAETVRTTFLHQLSRFFQWDEQALVTLTGRTGLDLSLSDLGDVDTIARLARIMSILTRVSVSVEGLLSMKKAAVTEDMARRACSAAKANYDAEAWLNIAEPIRDTLREEQRQALVDYIVARTPNVQNGNDLLGHLLIDVEMSSCMQTSRITQAISSVQLFVQRCLMNLEDVALSPADAKEWKQWRKSYRIWEANRKIFLYPENWIEPELRTEKSPFFKELEDDLMQQDVTVEAVEQAYREYVGKLTEVANLEVAGLCQESDEETGTQIVHVFARTRNTPHVYFYRQRVDDTYWTAWQRLDLDIEGDHLIPMIFNRRLTLFWPLFSEKVVEDIPTENADSSEKEAKKYWDIKMAWSVYQEGRWSAKQISEDMISTRLVGVRRSFPEKESIYFYTQGEAILCYGKENQNSQLFGIFVFDYCNNHLRRTYLSELYTTSIAPRFLSERLDAAQLAMHNDLEFTWTSHRMHLQIEDSGLVLPYENHEGSVFESVVLNKKRPYLLLPSPAENRYFRSRGTFFVIDQETKRTFFIIPDDQYMWVRDNIFDGWFKVPDIDLPRFDQLFDPRRIDTIIHWDKIATGRSDIMDPRDPLVGPVAPSNILKMSMDDEPQLFPLVAEEGLIISSEMPVMSRPIETFLHFPVSTGRWQWKGKEFGFRTFFHPYVCAFNENLIRYGVDGLLAPKSENPLYRQQLTNDFDFSEYEPVEDLVSAPMPEAGIDFSADGAYSLYNWELFFHIPFSIATQLSQNQRFEEAQKWFHYIFDPTTPPTEEERENEGDKGATARRFWKVKPFYEEEVRRLHEMLLLINRLDDLQAGTEDSSQAAMLESLFKQVAQWESNPFDPHTIARLRPVAYMKAVVMKYIDNLIAWGDHLFQQGTRETINEATHLYVLAAQILGERPQSIPAREVSELSFHELVADHDLDRLSNTEVEVEDWLPHLPPSRGPGIDSSLPTGRSLFYCIPKNEKLMGYWRTVEDRLFKIRHCMNIEGQVQQLPLFAPPIDPALLAAAAASGADIARAVSDLHVPLPHYRFQVLTRKAVELCQDVKGLGAALLAALEKRDGEKMAQLQVTHGKQLQEANVHIYTQRIAEAEDAVEGLERSRDVLEKRRDFYADREKWNAWEIAHLALVGTGVTLRGVSQLMMLGAAPLEFMPDVTAGVAGGFGSPVATTTVIGGQKAAGAVKNVSSALATLGSMVETGGQMASVVGGYERRWEEWEFQKEQAEKEMDRVDKQIDEANIRIAIAERELENLELQIQMSKEEEDYLTEKYTNDELYNWMVSQLSTLYFQSYELAYSVAKQAEKAYQFELGRHSETFITFGHWDNLRRGLLSGERLHHELQRMDVAYMNNDRREYELTKDVSLLQLNPYELIRLRETGACEIRLPETLFDQDYPGHYMRRIKSVSVTIPCVSGPHTSVNATLTLVQGRSRITTDTENMDRDDQFYESLGAYHTMATSHAHQDAGMFELNFQDERYLPFEGAGAESTWYLELPKDTNRVDFSTISDVLLHLSYTSRDGGPQLKQAARARRNEEFANEGLTVTYSAKQHFATDWHAFLHEPHPETNDHQMPVELLPDGFPSSSGHHITFDAGQNIVLLVKINEQALPDGQTMADLNLGDLKWHVGGQEIALQVGGSPEAGGLVEVDTVFSGQFPASDIEPDDWTLSFKASDIPEAFKTASDNGQGSVLNKDVIEDLWIICHYALEPSESN